MTLLEILVTKLDRWPDDYFYATQNASGHVYISRDEPKRSADVFGAWVTGCEYFHIHSLVFKQASDYKTSIVNRDDWQEAKKDKPIKWDGKGLPPAGSRCRIRNKIGGEDSEWVDCAIVAHGKEQIIFQRDGSLEWAGHKDNYFFSRIMTPEEKQRHRACLDMLKQFPSSDEIDYNQCVKLYDAGYRKVCDD